MYSPWCPEARHLATPVRALQNLVPACGKWTQHSPKCWDLPPHKTSKFPDINSCFLQPIRTKLNFIISENAQRRTQNTGILLNSSARFKRQLSHYAFSTGKGIKLISIYSWFSSMFSIAHITSIFHAKSVGGSPSYQMRTGVCTNTKKLQGRFPTSG
jgi:hypothetical protein